MLLFLFLDGRDRLLEAVRGVGVGGGMLPQHVCVAPETTPPCDDFFQRLVRGNQLLELGGQRLQAPRGRPGKHPAALAILERSAPILEPAVERRGVLRRHRWKAVPLHLELGDAIDGVIAGEVFDLADRSPRDPPARAPALRRAPVPPRAPAAARRSPRVPRQTPPRTAARCLNRPRRPPGIRPRPGGFLRTWRRPRPGSATVTIDSARCRSSIARWRSSAVIGADSSRAGSAGSSMARSLVRARRAATLLRARCAIAASGSGPLMRSSAATATSVCSAFSATLSSSSASAIRARARSRVSLSCA